MNKGLARSRWGRVALVTLLATGPVSCNRIANNYTLVRGDGRGLPLTLAMENQCAVLLAHGELTFERKSTYRSKLVLNKACLDGTQISDVGTHGRYARRGDTLFFLRAGDLPAGHGITMGDSIVVVGPDHVLTYLKSNKVPAQRPAAAPR